MKRHSFSWCIIVIAAMLALASPGCGHPMSDRGDSIDPTAENSGSAESPASSNVTLPGGPSLVVWRPKSDGPTPASKPDGAPFDVVFINRSHGTVKLFWMDRQGKPKFYADIPPGKRRRQRTRPGAVWRITDASAKPLGHFRVGDRTSRAIIPSRKPGPKKN